MITSELIQLVTAVSSLITPVIALIGFIELHRKTTDLKADVDVVRHETNSMKDELVNEVRVASLAKGRLDKETEIAQHA
jgi:hypothetical protein